MRAVEVLLPRFGMGVLARAGEVEKEERNGRRIAEKVRVAITVTTVQMMVKRQRGDGNWA